MSIKDESWKKIMEDPRKVLETLMKDIDMIEIREKVLPSGDAARLGMLEKEKDAITRINAKFAKTDYHTIYNQRVEKDSIEKIESNVNRYGIRLDIEDRRILLKLKKTGIPKLKAVVKETRRIKKGAKKRFKEGEFGELISIVRRGSQNVAARRRHSRMLIELGKERLNLIKEIYDGIGKVIGEGAKDIKTDELAKMEASEDKMRKRLLELNQKIALSEQAIIKYEQEADKIVDEFIAINERIRQSGSKDMKEIKQIRKEEGALAR